MATDNLTSSEEMMYAVHFSQEPDFNPDSTNFYTTVFNYPQTEITGLIADKTYYVLVIAIDQDGNRSLQRNYQSITIDSLPHF